MKLVSVVLCLLMLSAPIWAKKKIVSAKEQRVDFTGDTVDGTARTPDGSYVVQKRAVDFVPLYKVRDRFDENIKASVDYLK
jgi:hypothetical protein